jgi:hypothetical protein
MTVSQEINKLLKTKSWSWRSGWACLSADQFLDWPPASRLFIFREHLIRIGDTELAGRHDP